MIQVGFSDPALDCVPMLRAFLQFVRLVRDNLDRMYASRSACRICEAATNYVQWRILKIDCAALVVETHPLRAVGANHHSRVHGRESAAFHSVLWRLRGRIVCREQ